jgi:hypothetical protein
MPDDTPEPIADTAAFQAFSSRADQPAEPSTRGGRLALISAAVLLLTVILVVAVVVSVVL